MKPPMKSSGLSLTLVLSLLLTPLGSAKDNPEPGFQPLSREVVVAHTCVPFCCDCEIYRVIAPAG